MRAVVARKLEIFAEILLKFRVVQEVAPLYKAAAHCRSYSRPGKWGYSVENLLFRRLGMFKAFQHAFDLPSATLEFSVSLEGSCANPEGCDPLTSLALGIVISGAYESDGDVENALAAWHLDRHLGGANASEFMHPVYHLSFGGLQLEHMLDPHSLPVLLADTPRIAYPPMDAILGIDFVLANFLGESLSEVRNDGFYMSSVKDMQRLLWKPYVAALHSGWNSASNSVPWLPDIVWPQLLLQ